MYARMVPLLLRQAAFPADFTSWEECLSMDEEVFTRFRYSGAIICKLASSMQLPSTYCSSRLSTKVVCTCVTD